MIQIIEGLTGATESAIARAHIQLVALIATSMVDRQLTPRRAGLATIQSRSLRLRVSDAQADLEVIESSEIETKS